MSICRFNPLPAREIVLLVPLYTEAGSGIPNGLRGGRPPARSGSCSCELADLIEDPVFSFEVGAMKPEPAIYSGGAPAGGMRRLGGAVFVGDGGSSELAGARRVGVEPIWATWFLERWPSWRMSEVEPEAASCRRCRDPADLIGILDDVPPRS